MKKFVAIVLIVVLLVGGYSLYKKYKNASMSTDGQNNVPPRTATPSTAAAGLTYKDGVYTSDTFQTERGYGGVQLKVTIASGKITDVTFLQYPNHPGHTQEVSSAVMPALKQEAIAAQSAPVDSVSGATQTVDAFNAALSSALAMAK